MNRFIDILIISAIIIGSYFYLATDQLFIKAICSTGFVLLGAKNFFYSKDESNFNFRLSMLVGLIFAMLGDILLGINFIVGASFFAIGHIFYLLAYSFITPFCFRDFAMSSILSAVSISFVIFCPVFDFKVGAVKFVCIAYALVISTMLSKAAMNFFHAKSKLSTIIFVGSILFFFSDLMLSLNKFAGMGNLTSILCIATYYPAQCFLAESIFIK